MADFIRVETSQYYIQRPEYRFSSRALSMFLRAW